MQIVQTNEILIQFSFVSVQPVALSAHHIRVLHESLQLHSAAVHVCDNRAAAVRGLSIS